MEPLPDIDTAPLETLVSRVSTCIGLASGAMCRATFKVEDIICIQGEQCGPTKWPLARVKEVIQGDNGLVQVVIVGTFKATYRHL